MAILFNPLVGQYLFIFIGAIGSTMGVQIMQMYVDYCVNHNIYIDRSAGIAYGIYGMILGFIGIYIFFFTILIIYYIIRCCKNN
uniref:Uncharacterized protein n=1 Tax=Borely moumouvirus TaxID=2712067 RepID=A0A6G6ADW6_9VIRU